MTMSVICSGCGRTFPAHGMYYAGPRRVACSPTCILASLPDLRIAAWR
jgi:hypothetical protein